MRQRSARHDRRELAPDERVVIADASRAPGEMDAELQRREHRVAAHGNGRARRRWLIAFRDALQARRLCVRNQPLAIHRHGVRRAEVSEALGVRRARARPSANPMASNAR